MSRYDISAEVVAAIAAAGFQVYQPVNPKYRTWIFYTDGRNVAYLDTSDFGCLSMSTVHIPNRTCGTGFKVDGPVELTPEGLRRGFYVPHWASAMDRAASRPYPSLEAFLKAQWTPLELIAGSN